MDTGATSHMTADQGIFSSYFNSSNNNHHIVVGNGNLIPITGHGSITLPPPHPPLTLSNMLHAPKLIKNLISVRKFTTDNSVSVEFDPFGFFVNDLKTWTKIMRCDSIGDLYPIFSTHRAIPSSPSAFTTLTTDVWHNRLGHPGAKFLNFLRTNKLVLCNKARQNSCVSCPLGKLTKLPFYDSMSFTILPFDIIHRDLWTSPIASSSGHRYYVLFLDDFSKFLWTYRFSLISKLSMLLSKHNLNDPSRIFNVIMELSSLLAHLNNYVLKMVFNFVSLVLTPPLKMAKPKGTFNLSTISCVPFLLMLPFRDRFGPMHLLWLPIFLIFSHLKS